MNREALERMLKESQSTYFTDFLVIICQLSAIVTIFIFLKKEKFTLLFLVYCFAALLLFVTLRLRFLYYSVNESSRLLVEGENIGFAFVEYGVFYYFFKDILKLRVIKPIMRFFFIGMTAAVALFFYKVLFKGLPDSLILEYSDFIISPELLLLGILCLIYYFELIRKKIVYNLTQSPSFWIVTGLFFYSLAITPFFMIITSEFIISHKKAYYTLFALHHISFAFLFVVIIKAFLCRKPLTT